MTENPIELDTHRGMAAQKATEERRLRQAVQANEANLRERRDRLEAFLSAGPAASWRELGAKAAFLITLFAETAEGRDPRHRALIDGALDDVLRLSDGAAPGPEGT